MNPKHDTLLKALHECAIACEKCFDSSLNEEHVQHLANCIRLTEECARICRLTETLLASGSQYAGELIDICSDVCAGCARECERHPHEHCKVCASACRLCEEVCENFAPSNL